MGPNSRRAMLLWFERMPDAKNELRNMSQTDEVPAVEMEVNAIDYVY